MCVFRLIFEYHNSASESRTPRAMGRKFYTTWQKLNWPCKTFRFKTKAAYASNSFFVIWSPLGGSILINPIQNPPQYSHPLFRHIPKETMISGKIPISQIILKSLLHQFIIQSCTSLDSNNKGYRYKRFCYYTTIKSLSNCALSL